MLKNNREREICKFYLLHPKSIHTSHCNNLLKITLFLFHVIDSSPCSGQNNLKINHAISLWKLKKGIYSFPSWIQLKYLLYVCRIWFVQPNSASFHLQNSSGNKQTPVFVFRYNLHCMFCVLPALCEIIQRTFTEFHWVSTPQQASAWEYVFSLSDKQCWSL